jgi:glycopeptide antibiotics resistance protein
MLLKFSIPAILWAAFILFVSILPGGDAPQANLFGFLSVDKVVHATFHAGLVFLLMVGFSKQHSHPKFRYNPAWYAVTMSCLYGIGIELLQEFVIVQRNFEIYDLVANFSGALIGYGLFQLVYFKL